MAATMDARAAMRSLGAKAAKVDAATALALKRAGLVVERATKEKLSEQGRHRPGTPTPSPPGSPPSIITGALRASVRTEEPKRLGFGKYELMVGPTMVYARVQELGGGPRNLPARPYLRPAYEGSSDRAQAELVAAWNRAWGL